MHELHSTPPYGRSGLFFVFGSVLIVTGRPRGTPLSGEPHPAHFAGDGFLLT